MLRLGRDAWRCSLVRISSSRCSAVAEKGSVDNLVSPFTLDRAEANRLACLGLVKGPSALRRYKRSYHSKTAEGRI